MSTLKKIIILVSILLSASVEQAMAFGPCLPSVPPDISYLPSVPICGGKAALVMMGKYQGAFSAVMRDCNNNDRDPCHTQAGTCGTNSSSPYKVIKIVDATVKKSNGKKVTAKINCFREAGNSAAFALVRRFTVKLKNPATSPSDIEKVCLRSRTLAANPVKILTTGKVRIPSDGTGWVPACKTQGYLNCSLSYSSICPKY